MGPPQVARWKSADRAPVQRAARILAAAASCATVREHPRCRRNLYQLGCDALRRWTSARHGSKERLEAAARVPEGEDLNLILILVDAIVEVAMDACEQDATHRLETVVARAGSDGRLSAEQPEGPAELLGDRVPCCRAILAPPADCLTDLFLCSGDYANAHDQGSRASCSRNAPASTPSPRSASAIARRRACSWSGERVKDSSSSAARTVTTVPSSRTSPSTTIFPSTTLPVATRTNGP